MTTKKNEKKKIAAVVYGLNYGGVERVCLDYVKMLHAIGHNIELFVLNPKELDMAGEIPEGVFLHAVKLSPYLCPETYWRLAVKYDFGKYLFPFIYVIVSVLLKFYKLFFRYREKFDISIAFGGHVNDLTFVAEGFVKADKKLCWLHGGLYSYMSIGPSYQFLYRKIKNLVVLTDFAQNECLFFNKQLDLNIRKIFNPSFIESRKTDEKEIANIKQKFGDFIVMVARVDYPKNHEGLIKAMEYLYNKYGFIYNLVFVGEGPLRKDLEAYSEKSKIGKHVFFTGNQPDPQNFYAAAKLFALSTISEGLPTVLIEAAYFGLPLVASDASVKEILGANEYGLIAPVYDNHALGEQIYSLLTDPAKYDRYSRLAKMRYEQFAPDKISNQIDDFINNLK